MVGLTAALAGLKLAILRHTSAGMRRTAVLLGLLAVAGTWAAAVLAGSDHARAQVLMLVALAAVVAWLVGPSLSSGTGVLRPEFFQLLPLPRAKLSLGLLVTGFVGVGPLVSLGVFAALGVHAVALAPATLLVAAPGAILLLALAVTVSRLFFAAVGAAMHSRFGVELSGVQYGALVAAIFTAWMAVQAAVEHTPDVLREGLPAGSVATALPAAPTSWPVRAIDAAAAGSWAVALGWLAGLAAVTGVLAAVTVVVLAPRRGRYAPPASRRRRRQQRRRFDALLPATAWGAVLGKELRLWWRDPWRRLELRTMTWAGVIAGAVALMTGFDSHAPYAGLIVAFGAALAALNIYGQDGTAFWQTVVGAGPDTIRADVRARQAAVVLMTAPVSLVVTTALVLFTGAHELWPLLVALTAALLGAGSGLGLLLSVVGATPGVDPQHRVGPNDAGDVTFQVWAALLATSVLLAPVVAVGWAAAASGAPYGGAAALVVGIGHGWLLAWWLGRLAHRRLAARLPETFARLRYGRAVAAAQNTGSGLLDRMERGALDSNKERAPVGS